MKPIAPATPGQPLRASDINAVSGEVSRHSNVASDGAIVTSDGNGISLVIDKPEGFWAAIDGRVGYQYGWKEVSRDMDGRWNGYYPRPAFKSSSATDNFAIETNNSLTVPNGTVVWMTPIKSIVVDDIQRTVYQFTHTESGGSQVDQSVVVDVGCDNNGINLVKNTFAAYNFNSVYSPNFLSLSDVIPKSFAGAKNCVLTVNASETGLEFGAAVQGASGTGYIITQITNLQNQINSINSNLGLATTNVNILSARVLALETQLAAIQQALESIQTLLSL